MSTTRAFYGAWDNAGITSYDTFVQAVIVGEYKDVELMMTLTMMFEMVIYRLVAEYATADKNDNYPANSVQRMTILQLRKISEINYAQQGQKQELD